MTSHRVMTPGAFTLADIHQAVRLLEACNVPKCKCQKCGAGFYLANPKQREDGTFIVPPLCAECDE